jgi:hypothetical protein
MARVNHFVDRSRTFCCGIIVVMALGSLTVNLATRYGGRWQDSPSAVRTIQTHIPPDAKRQRLVNNCLNWLPPVFSFTGLEAPIFSAEALPAGANVRGPLLEESLYNRPPPAV